MLCHTMLHCNALCYTELHLLHRVTPFSTDLAAPKQRDVFLDHTIIILSHKAFTLVLHNPSVMVDLEGRGRCTRFGEVPIPPLMSVVEFLDQELVTCLRHLIVCACSRCVVCHSYN